MRPVSPKVEKMNKLPFTYLYAHLGDRDIRKYRRVDANSYLQFLLTTKKVKTTSVRRYINTLRAAWNITIREREMDEVKNIWQSLEIPKLGQDSEKRLPFTVADYKVLYRAIGVPQDDLIAMVALLAETGARLGEIVGLGVDDCVIEGVDVPYVMLRHRPLETPEERWKCS
jgi:integrase